MGSSVSTGISGLDKILCSIRKGDNIVWQVESVDDYEHFVRPYVQRAVADGRNIIYMRFAKHRPVIEDTTNVTVYQLDAASGFETFSTQVHTIIRNEGLGAYYVFDCLSDLLSAWATDLMIGNFFMVTCPYLFELDTIAYFAILRHHHSYQTVARIRGTTQLLLDLYDFEGQFYVHPLKVWDRHSPTMFLPHGRHGDDFQPVISSVEATKLFSHISQTGLDGAERILDYWDRLFLNAQTMLGKKNDDKDVRQIIEELCRIMIGKDSRISSLAQQHLSLDKLINIKSRLVGTGSVGGKAAGMLLAQNILLDDQEYDWNSRMEPHDSFYIGSDIFYTYIVENGWWKLFMEQKTPEGYFSAAIKLKENLLKGKFPDHIRERFQEVIEYFGQSPIIVRSSSLLEDSFGNAFAGKYESIFLVNQGSPDERYTHFEEAVRRIFASTMDENALTYRKQRGLDQQDEQMALLVQRVSGSYRNSYFFPDLAGVGVSYNTFVWEPTLDPKAGMLRLVFGLGTRAVERVEEDYPQTIALDQPLLRPYSGHKDIRKYSQHKIDLLDTKENSLRTVRADEVLNIDLGISTDLIATEDRATQKKMESLGLKSNRAWIVTFEKLLSDTDFTETMQRILSRLESSYKYPVDIEFTVNFTKDGEYKINLVQCRPLQTKGLRANVQMPSHIEDDKVLFSSMGYTMGGSIRQPIKRIIYIEPKAYTDLGLSQKYDIARLVGKLNKQITGRQATPTILIGPGRWGTTTPSLGVPVSFSEINNIAVLSEIAYEGGNLMPELSFGTHFFQDLVESNIFYIAIFPQKQEVVFNENRLLTMSNVLHKLLPDSQRYADVVKVFDVDENQLQVIVDIVTQKVVCFFK